MSKQRAMLLAVTVGLFSSCVSKAPVASRPPEPPSETPKPAVPEPVIAAPVPHVPTPPDPSLKEAALIPSQPLEGSGWTSMFDGKSLKGWRETEFGGRGEVQCEFGLVILNQGDPFTGIAWTNSLPKMNYEVALDAMRISGSDFFCGLTFPVGNTFCSLIVGGWGGSLVGISSLDGEDASENETTRFINFKERRWYRIRVRVTPKRLEGWIDNERLVNVATTGKKLSLRAGDIELSKPFGIASWQTTAVLRRIEMRRIEGPAGPAPKNP